MGAGNVVRVYNAWAAELTGKTFQVLGFMALTARDMDADPWYGEGHEKLGASALGLKFPEPDDHSPEAARLRAVLLRKVRRHITPLLNAKAIETRTPATYGMLGPSYVVYRLYLDGPGVSSPFPPSRNR